MSGSETTPGVTSAAHHAAGSAAANPAEGMQHLQRMLAFNRLQSVLSPADCVIPWTDSALMAA